MTPRLYEANEARKPNAFQTLGLGALGDAISCTVTEERNGEYELELVYPVGGIHYNDISMDRLIYAKPNETSGCQIFRIYKVGKPIDGQVTINAEHISYLLRKAVTLPFTAASANGAFTNILSNVIWPTSKIGYSFPFKFWTDNDTNGTVEVGSPSSIKSVLMGEEGSILDACGGEYEFDNFTVKLYKQRGADTGVTLRYGKNITDLTDTSDLTDVYTGILPYWKGTVTTTYTEKDSNGKDVEKHGSEERIVYVGSDQNSDAMWLTSDAAAGYGYPQVIPVDFSSEIQIEASYKDSAGNDLTKSVNTQISEIKSALTEKAQEYVKNNYGWKPSSKLEVSFVNLWDTEEYKDISALERVSLCDKVSVFYPKLGVSTKMKVTKTVYNVLLGVYDSIELSDNSSNTSSTEQSALNADTAPQKAQEQIIAALQNSEADLRKAITLATSVITGGLGGHVVFNKDAQGKPNEILIMDTDSTATAKNVIRMNVNGIGFSTHGYNGPYETAWTIDGNFNAKWITTGVLTAIMIQTASSGKRIVIQNDDATISGYTDNSLKSVIDMVSDWGGTLLIDSSNTMAIRTPKLIVSTTSQGDQEGTGTVTITNDSPFVTNVEKHYGWDGDGGPVTYEFQMSDECLVTLPVYLDVTWGGSKIINGWVCGSVEQTVKTI